MVKAADSQPPARGMSPRFVVTLAWGAIGLLWLGALASWVMTSDATLMEMPVYLTVIALILHSAEVRGMLASIGLFRQIVVGGFVLGLLFAQVFHEERQYYPFVTWRMYSTPPKVEVEYRELVVIGPGGEARRIPFRTWSPFRTGIPFCERLNKASSDPELLTSTIQSLIKDHPMLEGAEKLEWRLWSVKCDERPIRPQQALEGTIEIPIP
jgi:hypothetical protein